MSPIRSTISWSKAAAAVGGLVLCALVLAGCGFEPVYGARQDAGTAAEFATIRIDPIEERVGQLLRNQLLDSLNTRGEPPHAAYRLQVIVTEIKQEVAVQRSELATRSNMVLTATYRLLDISNKAYVMTRTSTVSASYNVLSNEFATLANEADVRERGVHDLSEDITRQLALFFRNRATAQKR